MAKQPTGNLSFRPSFTQYAIYIVASTILLTAIISLPGNNIEADWYNLLLVVLLILILQLVVQPIFNWITRMLGILGILLVSLFGFTFIFWLALSLAPNIEDITFWDSLLTAWLYALFVTVLQWVLLAQSDTFLLRNALHAQRGHKVNKTDEDGFVFVQLDGVSHELLEWELNAGNLPNIKSLIDSGEYKLRSWDTQIPSTTPASQAGILLGSNDNIPAFRWYERDTGQLVVANQPIGAATIENRLSSGKGLLADGGVSIGNLFSGDAPTNIMVMSKMGEDRSSLKGLSEYTAYLSSIQGFMRVLILSIGEMVKEVYQARRQSLKDVKPRVNRKSSYILLRAGTNVALRDLQTVIVIQKMLSGVNSLYVDYLDYDEIAHHAGIARPESLGALGGLDTIVGILINTKQYATRPYKIVFLSDHGQSQGPTFKQLHNGQGLEAQISKLMKSNKISAQLSDVESNSASQSLLDTTAHKKGLRAKLIGKIAKKQSQEPESQTKVEDAEIVVTASGNLGNIWLKKYKKRASIEQITVEYPDLINNILDIEGIGLVLINTDKYGPICKNSNGFIELKTGKIHSKNPLKKYPGFDYTQLYKLSTMKVAPDIQIISDMNTSTGEVFAFEELVGNHGGIGGFQNHAMMLYPSELKIKKRHLTNSRIVDSTSIHKILVSWLESAGQRKDFK